MTDHAPFLNLTSTFGQFDHLEERAVREIVLQLSFEYEHHISVVRIVRLIHRSSHVIVEEGCAVAWP